jgi:hypothetical protein
LLPELLLEVLEPLELELELEGLFALKSYFGVMGGASRSDAALFKLNAGTTAQRSMI